MISLGMVAGVMGSFVGTPTDLILVRMATDIYLPQGISCPPMFISQRFWMEKSTKSEKCISHLMQNLFLEKRKNYKTAIHGIVNIWKTEGFTRLWRGAVPTMGRAAVVNGSQLGTYTRAKLMLQDTGC